MPYFSPILAYGQDSLCSLMTSASAGATSIQINPAEEFAVGDPLFIREHAGTELEYLGAITAISVDGHTLTFTNPLRTGKMVTAHPWRPIQWMRFSMGAGWTWSKRLIPGVRTRVSRGGVIYPTQTADPYWRLIFNWEKKAIADFEAVLEFLAAYRHDGRDPFTLAFWDHFSDMPRICIAYLALGASDDDAVANADLAGLLGRVEQGGSTASYSLQFISTDLDASGAYQYQVS